MRTIVLLLVMVVGCADDEPVKRDELPLCKDLGCENAFCTRDGLCTCMEEQCVACDTPDRVCP